MSAPSLSIKGVILHQGRVLLLENDRAEWDLPGGRPGRDEDHRAALVREVKEETGLAVEVGALIEEHLFEVLPQRFVRIIAYVCLLRGGSNVALSEEHHAARWLALADLRDGITAGRTMPAGYLAAIRSAADLFNAGRSSS